MPFRPILVKRSPQGDSLRVPCWQAMLTHDKTCDHQSSNRPRGCNRPRTWCHRKARSRRIDNDLAAVCQRPRGRRARSGTRRVPEKARLQVTEQRPKNSILPLSLPPRGLSRLAAAEYVGVGPTLFDEMVKDGRMPRPKRVNSRTIWDLRQIDRAFDALPSENPPDDDDWEVET